MKKSTTGEFETAVFAARLRELIRDTKTTQKPRKKILQKRLAQQKTPYPRMHMVCAAPRYLFWCV